MKLEFYVTCPECKQRLQSAGPKDLVEKLERGEKDPAFIRCIHCKRQFIVSENYEGTVEEVDRAEQQVEQMKALALTGGKMTPEAAQDVIKGMQKKMGKFTEKNFMEMVRAAQQTAKVFPEHAKTLEHYQAACTEVDRLFMKLPKEVSHKLMTNFRDQLLKPKEGDGDFSLLGG